MSRLFYGRALFLDGYREEALEQFNSPKVCTSTIALCKEPSQEYRRYLLELVEAGADMDLVEEQSYTAASSPKIFLTSGSSFICAIVWLLVYFVAR